MDTAAHLSLLARDGESIGALTPADLDRRVPSCPDWSVADLLAHVSGIHRWVSAILAEGGPVRRSTLPRAPEGGGEPLIEWYRNGLHQVVTDLSARSPGDETWTFAATGPGTVSWWARRMALETAVHRADAQLALGAGPDPLDSALAVEGIDETFTVFLPMARSRGAVEGLHGSLHVHTTDAEGEWWLDLDQAEPEVRREHAKADTAVRGPASDVYLWMWNRRSSDGLEIFGDAAVAAAWTGVRF